MQDLQFFGSRSRHDQRRVLGVHDDQIVDAQDARVCPFTALSTRFCLPLTTAKARRP